MSDLQPARTVVATVYAVLDEFGIVRLRLGSELFAYNCLAEGVPSAAEVEVGDQLELDVGPRLNKVLAVRWPGALDR